MSAMGADPKSKIFYSRVKGDLENALGLLPYQGLVIARPSLLVGDRDAVGQPKRRGEELGLALSKAVGFLIPPNYKPIKAADVANALLIAVPWAKGKTVMLSGSMHGTK